MVQKVFEFDNFEVADENAPAILDLSINRPFVPTSEDENSQKLLEELTLLLQQLEKEKSTNQARLGELGNFSLPLTIELGQIEFELQDIANEKIIELNQSVNEEINICLNGCLVAKGRLMIESDRLGVELTEILKVKE